LLQRARDGGVVTVNLTCHAVRNPDGSIRYIEAFVEDVTRRTDAERMLLAKVRNLQILKAIHEALGATLSLPEIYAYVRTQLHAMLSHLHVDRVSLMIANESQTCLAGEHDIGPEGLIDFTQALLQPVGLSISGLCLAQKRMVLVRDCLQSDVIPQKFVEELSLRTSVAVPILRGERALGVLRFDNIHEPDMFDEEAVEVFGIVAHQFAPIIETAMLFARQRLAEEALRRADTELKFHHSLLRTVQEVAPSGILVTGPEGQWLVYNQRYLDIWGLDERLVGQKRVEDVLAHTYSQVENAEQYRDCVEKAFACPESVVTGEVRLKNQRIYDLYSAPVQGVDGVRHGRVWYLLDVTEQRRAAEAVLRSEERFRALTELSLDIVQVFDSDGIITYQSPSHERLLGYDRDELVGRNTFDQFHPDDRAAGMATIECLLAGQRGSIVTFEHRYRLKDGSYCVLESSCANQLDNPAVRGIVVNARDVTQRRQTEEALRAAKAAAEEAVRAKSAFLATMSHEIRTPLNGVIGMAQLLLGTPLTGQQRSYASTVCTAADSLLSIVNNIMDFSKIEAGMLELENLDFDLPECVEAVREIMAARVREKSLKLNIAIVQDVPRALRGDTTRLRQVLLNLVGDAVKFTDPGGSVSVLVSLAEQDADSVVLRFEVSDSGIGVPPDSLKRLFRPFTQADASMSRLYGGTGLGLAICKQLVGLMGGEIGVQSQPGRGSTFWFTARFGRAKAARRTRPSAAEKLRRLRILVAESNPMDRARTAAMLSSWGCSYSEATDARQALETLRAAAATRRPFNVAILGACLGDTDTRSLASEIKADPNLSPTALILLTDKPKNHRAAELLKLRFEWYLTKPLNQSQLLNALLSLGPVPTSAILPAPASIIDPHAISTPRRLKAISRLRILVAEDNPINQEVAVSILEREGFECRVASTGEEVLRLLEQEHFDVILMDCQMPVMDGLEATRRIRLAETGNRHLPIIAMTAEALHGDRERCLAAGMDDYLSKPVTVEQLLAAIKRWAPTAAFMIVTETSAKGSGEAHSPSPAMKRTQDTEPLAGEGDGLPPPADLSYLRSAVDTARTLQRMIDVFLAQSEDQLARLAAAIEAGNCDDARFLAHALKGAALNYKADRMSWLAHRIEIAAEEGRLESTREILCTLREEFARVKHYLETERYR
jgi:PAS domain S-box-containing protein